MKSGYCSIQQECFIHMKGNLNTQAHEKQPPSVNRSTAAPAIHKD